MGAGLEGRTTREKNLGMKSRRTFLTTVLRRQIQGQGKLENYFPF